MFLLERLKLRVKKSQWEEILRTLDPNAFSPGDLARAGQAQLPFTRTPPAPSTGPQRAQPGRRQIATQTPFGTQRPASPQTPPRIHPRLGIDVGPEMGPLDRVVIQGNLEEARGQAQAAYRERERAALVAASERRRLARLAQESATARPFVRSPPRYSPALRILGAVR